MCIAYARRLNDERGGLPGAPLTAAGAARLSTTSGLGVRLTRVLFSGRLVVLVLRHASVANPGHLRMSLQVLSERHRVFTVTLEAQRERLKAKEQAPRVERALAAAEVAEALHPAANCKADVDAEGAANGRRAASAATHSVYQSASATRC